MISKGTEQRRLKKKRRGTYPNSWVVGRKGEKQKTASRHGRRIPPRGIVKVQPIGRLVPDSTSFPEQIEVVAVEVNGVRQSDCACVLDPPQIPAVYLLYLVQV